MDSYEQRAVRFFLESIQTLKNKSGAQRWNAICEDAATVWEQIYPTHLTHEELWEILFEPPEDIRNPLYMKFEILCAKPGFPDVFFRILHALLDPPSSWWQTQVKDTH